MSHSKQKNGKINSVVRLDPGELFIGERPGEVHTILGSCVSVVIYHPLSRLGAISHARLPSQTCSQPQCGLKICRNMGDYVSCSLQFMLSYFDHKAVFRKELEVKIFGGALMFSLPGRKEQNAIGKRNVEMAMDVIRRERLHLKASDVGGFWGRSITFDTGTGDVRLQRIRKSAKELALISE